MKSAQIFDQISQSLLCVARSREAVGTHARESAEPKRAAARQSFRNKVEKDKSINLNPEMMLLPTRTHLGVHPLECETKC